jgi:hypothetical protein
MKFTPGSTPSSSSGRRVRHFAVVVVVAAIDEIQASAILEEKLNRDGIKWIGQPCPTAPAGSYEVTEIRLIGDDEQIVTAPSR